MKTIYILDTMNKFNHNHKIYNLNELKQKDCCGCFSCWLKTPGVCIYNDSTSLLQDYVSSDLVVIIADLKYGFVSGKLKTFLDRLLPLYLPHSRPEENGYNHIPRYSKYPDIHFYYIADFELSEEQETFVNYILRTFTQFRSKNIVVKQITSINEVKAYENSFD
ncbi:flavodoxin family protein [Clostridium sp. 'deep sea']|uniref:flavodoxin family protein n=1 Tax=Clostridium sp. 'deep sea' TaxID=2779445 RepID=UPI00189660D9|nr:flavodoxin family protein [Clostridium sp. 'deep sea']QOR34875.1 flavodoxin family protein [Clostridium sp. 'deep sea']